MMCLLKPSLLSDENALTSVTFCSINVEYLIILCSLAVENKIRCIVKCK